jgi:chaperonin cofactor prefoldin|tara:strand:+ start:367 stop:714 length:348 start_codon:yes stop_codon:yes gene_type:complete
MASKEELYVSFSPDSYKSNKSNLLMSQADLLATLKRLHHLKILARQKQDLKKKLYKLFSSTLSEIDSIQDNMPTPKVPKTVQKSDEPKVKESFTKRDDIEDELKAIQEKLRELNS